MASIFDAATHRQWVADSMDCLKHDRNLTIYYQWCLTNKRFWLDSLADWCRRRRNLTPQMISAEYRRASKWYRGKDLFEKVAAINRLRIHGPAMADAPGIAVNENESETVSNTLELELNP